jgi:hypothetical protein
LDDDSIQELAQKIKPELWGILSNRFTEVLEKRNEQRIRDERILAAPKVNAEDNASGEKLLADGKSEYIQ